MMPSTNVRNVAIEKELAQANRNKWSPKVQRRIKEIRSAKQQKNVPTYFLIIGYPLGFVLMLTAFVLMVSSLPR